MIRIVTCLIFCLGVFSLQAQVKEKLPCVDKKFSIVVHYVRDSVGNTAIPASKIQLAITTLNNRFSPICVSFEICETRYIDNYRYANLSQNAHWEEIQNLYHVKNRINLYVVFDVSDPKDATGFADLGGITLVDGGGIAIKSTGALTHEMGHYFGLQHTFHDDVLELVDGSNCETAGDGICDTPADPFVKGDSLDSYIDKNCKFISTKKDANGQYYNPKVCNIMSYYSFCTSEFSHDQYMKMAKTFLAKPNMW